MNHSPVSRTNTLQKKLEPLLRRLVNEGILDSYDQEVDLKKRTGYSYRADYLAKLPNGMNVDIEADLTSQHNQKNDLTRDEALIVQANISTIRLNQSELSNLEDAYEKLKGCLSRIKQGEKLTAGSTQNRRSRAWKKLNNSLPVVALYVAISGADKGGRYGTSYAAKKVHFNKKNSHWEPTENIVHQPLVKYRKIASCAMPKRDAAALLMIEALDELRLQRSNILVYANISGDIFKVASQTTNSSDLILRAKKLLHEHNVCHWFNVSPKQFENAEQDSNHSILGEQYREAKFYYDDLCTDSAQELEIIERQTRKRIDEFCSIEPQETVDPTINNKLPKLSSRPSVPTQKSEPSKKHFKISDMVKLIKENDPVVTKKLTAAKANQWLIKTGYVFRNEDSTCIPTEKGSAAGIVVRQKTFKGNKYDISLYPADFQLVLIEHLNEIVGSK